MRFNHVEDLNRSGLGGIVSVAHARRTLAWRVINELAGERGTPSDDPQEPHATDRQSRPEHN